MRRKRGKECRAEISGPGRTVRAGRTDASSSALGRARANKVWGCTSAKSSCEKCPSDMWLSHVCGVHSFRRVLVLIS